jgi:hypothetical protein
MPVTLLPNSPPLDDEKARFTSARVKVLESKLIIHSDLERLKGLNAEDTVKQVRLYHAWASSNPLEFRIQSYNVLFKTTMQMAKECDTPDLYWYFALPTIFAQLQSFLEGNTVPDYPVDCLSQYFEKNETKYLPGELGQVANEANKFYEAGRKGYARRLLTSRMLLMLAESRFNKDEYFKEFLKRWTFIVQIRLYISSIERKSTLHFVNPDQYDTPEEILLEARKLGIKDLSISVIERNAEKILFDHVKSARMTVAGMEVIFCYLFELTKEFEKIAEILAGTVVKTAFGGSHAS